MDKAQQFLQVSAKLYQHLTDTPKDENREDFIDKIHELLDERSECIVHLQNENFVFDNEIKLHQMLLELDKGIHQRLETVMTTIQSDLKVVQNSKKNEKQYINPYSSIQTMDGRYYDKKN